MGQGFFEFTMEVNVLRARFMLISLKSCVPNDKSHKENLVSAKPSGAGGRLSCTYASRKYITECYTFCPVNTLFTFISGAA